MAHRYIAGTIVSFIYHGSLTVVLLILLDTVVHLIADKVGDGDSPTSLSTINQAVEYCVDNKANVINMSLGGGSFSQSTSDLMQGYVDDGRRGRTLTLINSHTISAM